MESRNPKTACTFAMLFSLWSDVFNILVGVGALVNSIWISGIGYIVVHSASIIYLMFYKKLGFKYHFFTTRILMVVPDIFLLTNTLLYPPRWSWRYGPFGLEITSLCVGFAWSLMCALLALATHCKCTRRSRDSSSSMTSRNKGKMKYFQS